MARLPRRIDYDGAVHHVWGRGNGKNVIFRDAEDNRCFLRRLKALQDELGFELFAYCLMVNHYHLVIKPLQSGLTVVMHRLLTAYSRMFNDRWRTVGHVFQDRFKNRALATDIELMVGIRYVHLNPVEARLVASADDWAWSGHHAIEGRPDGLVNDAYVREVFGGLEGYRDFLAEAATKELPPLEQLALEYGGIEQLRKKTRGALDVDSRRGFVGRAIELGYKQRDVAGFLERTESAISHLIRGT